MNIHIVVLELLLDPRSQHHIHCTYEDPIYASHITTLFLLAISFLHIGCQVDIGGVGGNAWHWLASSSVLNFLYRGMAGEEEFTDSLWDEYR
jgi:hypothetical protein